MKNVIVNDMQRGSGKTKQVTGQLLYNPQTLVIVPNSIQKRHMIDNQVRRLRSEGLNIPATEHTRNYMKTNVVTIGDVLKESSHHGININRGEYKKIVIDEGLTLDFERMYNLMYILGKTGIPVEIFGSSHVYTDRIDAVVRQLQG